MAQRKSRLEFPEWSALLEATLGKFLALRPDAFTAEVLKERLHAGHASDWAAYGNGWSRKRDCKELRKDVAARAKSLEPGERAGVLQSLSDLLLRLHSLRSSELHWFLMPATKEERYVVPEANDQAWSEAVLGILDIVEALARRRDALPEPVALALLQHLGSASLLSAARPGYDVSYPFVAVARMLAAHRFTRVEGAGATLACLEAGAEVFPMDSAENREIRKVLKEVASTLRASLRTELPEAAGATKPLDVPFKSQAFYKVLDEQMGLALRELGFERVKCTPSRWCRDQENGRLFYCMEVGKYGWSREGGGEFSVSAYLAPRGTAFADVDQIRDGLHILEHYSDEEYRRFEELDRAAVEKIKSLRFTDSNSRMLHEMSLTSLDLHSSKRSPGFINPGFYYYDAGDARAWAAALLERLARTIREIEAKPRYAFSDKVRKERS